MRFGLVITLAAFAPWMSACAYFDAVVSEPPELAELTLDEALVNEITEASFDGPVTPGRAFAVAEGIQEHRTLMFRYLGHSDRLCDEYMTNVSITRNTLASGLGVVGDASLVTGIASALPNTAGAWTAVGAVANSTRNSLETEVLGGRNLPALLLVLRAARARERADLLDRLVEANRLEEVEALSAHLQAYHAGCGINRALAEVGAQAGQAQLEAMRRIAAAEGSDQLEPKTVSAPTGGLAEAET